MEAFELLKIMNPTLNQVVTVKDFLISTKSIGIVVTD
jgi:hypothetical protein